MNKKRIVLPSIHELPWGILLRSIWLELWLLRKFHGPRREGLVSDQGFARLKDLIASKPTLEDHVPLLHHICCTSCVVSPPFFAQLLEG